MGYEDVINMLKFGAITENICELYLDELINPDNLPDIANSFYDLYIEDQNKNLVDIPVLITNFVDQYGNMPNLQTNSQTGQVSSDQSQWRFTRRFMIYDTVSGIDQTNGYTNGSVPSIVRWASSITLKVTLDPDNKGQIYIPYVEITYREKMTNLIHDSTTS